MENLNIENVMEAVLTEGTLIVATTSFFVCSITAVLTAFVNLI